MKVLMKAGKPMRIVEVQESVQLALSRPVRYGSIVKLLCAEARDPGSDIHRDARGSYVVEDDA